MTQQPPRIAFQVPPHSSAVVRSPSHQPLHRSPAGGREGQTIILDTNIVLDVFVFNDPAAGPVRQGLEDASLDWIATPAMRVELARVLGYPQIVPRLAFYRLEAADVLSAFDRHVRTVDAALKAGVTCKDPDDQIFIDLAVAHRALLLSKDRAVTSMARRLAALGAGVRSAL